VVTLKKITTEGARYPWQVSPQADKEKQATIFCHISNNLFVIEMHFLKIFTLQKFGFVVVI
jgi:hypothetical protein